METGSNGRAAPEEVSQEREEEPLPPAAEAAPLKVSAGGTLGRVRERLGSLEARRVRGGVALVLAAILYSVAAIRLVPAALSTQSPSSGNAPAPAAVSALASVPTGLAQVERLLGAGAGLKSPQEAVPLPSGGVAVVDTGNARIAFLNAHGGLMSSAASGPSLKNPYAVAASSRTVYVVDAQLGSIFQYDLHGRYLGLLAHATPLNDARGLALGPDGNLYAASPGFNAIAVVSPSGVIRLMPGSTGGKCTQFNQPSDVAVTRSGMIYVLDNGNQRVCEMTASGTFVGEWIAPSSSTQFSSHVLPLPDGRLLLSDPAQGSLVLYARGADTPTRLIFHGKGTPLAHGTPLGLALTAGGQVLVTDGGDAQLLVVKLPGR
jgi:hypothetical protein